MLSTAAFTYTHTRMHVHGTSVDSGDVKFSNGTLSQCHFVHQKNPTGNSLIPNTGPGTTVRLKIMLRK